jgi:hypothetical protein
MEDDSSYSHVLCIVEKYSNRPLRRHREEGHPPLYVITT